MSEIADGYYAVPDPDDPGVITCWRYSKTTRQRLRPWSGGASYGTPLLPSRRYPPKPWTPEVKEAARQWWADLWQSIEDDPDGARTRFGQLTGSCWNCGRALTDPVSKVHGIGPDCRGKLGWSA